MTEILTIGHSTLPLEQFLALLASAKVTAIADVRSSPWSRFNPQFNRDQLKQSLKANAIAYRFFGRQLGGRPSDPSLFYGATADYEAMARTIEFAEGLKLVLDGAKKHRVALMCSEHDPLDCHRCLLVGRSLTERGSSVRHILSNGETKSQNQIEDTLLSMSGRDCDDLFAPRSERLNAAYRERSLRVAYAERQSASIDDQDFQKALYG